ncbi:hypothetical protein Tco_0077365 [Tanacetum coccineum]
MVCPLNENKIDFRISLDEFDDEDYIVIFDENSFSYKIISFDDLKSDSGNDNDNIPSSPNLTVDYFNDLDFFKDFENEFPAIVYNDAQTSKLDYLTEPILNPQHIDEFNLNDETSLSEYDEDEQNGLHFNDLFLFGIIHPDDLKSEKDNDDNDIDIIQCSKEAKILTHDMAPLPTADQRHPWIRYQVEGYIEGIRHIYEQRLEMIWSRPVNRVHVLDFEGLTPEMRQDLAVRLRMVYTGERGQAHDKVTDVDLFYLRGMDRGTTDVPYLLAQYLFRHDEGRKIRARLSGGHFIRHLAMHFGLVSDQGLRGLQGPERQQAAAAGAHEADKTGPAANEDAQDIPAKAPLPLPPAP